MAAAARKQAFEERLRQKEVEKEQQRAQAMQNKEREKEALEAARRDTSSRTAEQQRQERQELLNRMAQQDRQNAQQERQNEQDRQDGRGQEQEMGRRRRQSRVPANEPPPESRQDTGNVGVEAPPSNQWQVRDGFYVNAGGDIGAPFASIDECRAACEKTEECRSITMYKKMGHCTMKTHARISTHSDWYSELKESQDSPWLVVPDTYISGGDDATIIAYYTLPECRAACLKFPNCVAITQNENSNECFLKTKAEIFPHQSWHTEVLKQHAHLIRK